MIWAEIIENILMDFRCSEYELAEKTGLTQAGIHKLRKGLTEKPNQNTIKRLEEGLSIKIDDRNPEDITYKKLATANQPTTEYTLNKFPLITKVYGGDSMAMFVSDNISEYVLFPYPKKDRCFVVKVSGNSMNHKIEEGDLVLVDMDKEIINGCIVVARLNSGKQIIKRYRELPGGLSMFYSDNGGFEPLTMQSSEIEAIYRVVKVMKDV